MMSDINFLAVLVAAILYFVIGMIWYSPQLFGKTWMELSRLNPDECKKNMCMTTLAGCFAVGLVMSFVVAHFVHVSNAITAMDGAKVGFWAWLGFGATIPFSGVLWEKKPLHLYLINSGCYLVILLLIGALLAVWR